MSARTLVAAAVAVLAVPAAAHAVGEPYGWSLSTSSTDPFVQTAPALPEPGFFDVWLWLVCHEADGVAAAEFDVVPGGNLLIAGFVSEASVINFGSTASLMLAIGGCPVPPFRAGRLVVVDLGGGGTLCLGPSAMNGLNASVDCGFPQPTAFPNGVLGFSSDGSAPCVIGDCVDLAVSADEPRMEFLNWGRVKGIYR